jgi:hypothetical protein
VRVRLECNWFSVVPLACFGIAVLEVTVIIPAGCLVCQRFTSGYVIHFSVLHHL